MSVHPLTAAVAAERPEAAAPAPRLIGYVAARSWWMLKTHVAEANGLPRSSAGPEPRPPPRG